MDKRIRIAFIKYDGLSTGGTEKFLQTIAANLNKQRYSVDYFYCDPPKHIRGPQITYAGTSPIRLKYLQEKGVKVIKFNIDTIDLIHPHHLWYMTDFWQVFDENKYDIIQTGRAGHKEYPFTKIHKTPIIDSIHLTAGTDNQYNIAKVMHLTKWSADKWVRSGGDKKRVVIISHPIEIEDTKITDLRSELAIDSSKFVYGFHQRISNDIFSPIPLEAYKLIEDGNTHFIILGGGSIYRDQAKELNIKNITFLDHTSDRNRIFSFLKTLNVYAHGRKDGEVNSTAMAEAMYFSLPIISHTSRVNNGHIECIGNAGYVVSTVDEYAHQLQKIRSDKDYYLELSQNAKDRFLEMYDLRNQMNRIEEIYESVYQDPYPHKIKRVISSLHWTQNIRDIFKYLYRKTKYLKT